MRLKSKVINLCGSDLRVPIPHTSRITYNKIFNSHSNDNYSNDTVVNLSVIDLIQKSINQQGQKWQLFFHSRFSVIILSVLFQQSKSELASHTSSHFFLVATTQKI
jgi:hypothetical protein